jgi:hypothetical protein
MLAHCGITCGFTTVVMDKKNKTIFDLLNGGRGIQIIELLIVRSFLHSPVTSSLLDPNILLDTIFSNTLSLRAAF